MWVWTYYILVDRLEELFNESKPIWFTHSVIVDEDRMLDLIDQMRITIPDEIKKSQQLLAQSDRILAQAQEEASRTIALAREKGEKLVENEPITQAAQTRAEQIIAQARLEGEQTKKETDDYDSAYSGSHGSGIGKDRYPGEKWNNRTNKTNTEIRKQINNSLIKKER